MTTGNLQEPDNVIYLYAEVLIHLSQFLDQPLLTFFPFSHFSNSDSNFLLPRLPVIFIIIQ